MKTKKYLAIFLSFFLGTSSVLAIPPNAEEAAEKLKKVFCPENAPTKRDMNKYDLGEVITHMLEIYTECYNDVYSFTHICLNAFGVSASLVKRGDIVFHEFQFNVDRFREFFERQCGFSFNNMKGTFGIGEDLKKMRQHELVSIQTSAQNLLEGFGCITDQVLEYTLNEYSHQSVQILPACFLAKNDFRILKPDDFNYQPNPILFEQAYAEQILDEFEKENPKENPTVRTLTNEDFFKKFIVFLQSQRRSFPDTELFIKVCITVFGIAFDENTMMVHPQWFEHFLNSHGYFTDANTMKRFFDTDYAILQRRKCISQVQISKKIENIGIISTSNFNKITTELNRKLNDELDAKIQKAVNSVSSENGTKDTSVSLLERQLLADFKKIFPKNDSPGKKSIDEEFVKRFKSFLASQSQKSSNAKQFIETCIKVFGISVLSDESVILHPEKIEHVLNCYGYYANNEKMNSLFCLKCNYETLDKNKFSLVMTDRTGIENFAQIDLKDFNDIVEKLKIEIVSNIRRPIRINKGTSLIKKDPFHKSPILKDLTAPDNKSKPDECNGPFNDSFELFNSKETDRFCSCKKCNSKEFYLAGDLNFCDDHKKYFSLDTNCPVCNVIPFRDLITPIIKIDNVICCTRCHFFQPLSSMLLANYCNQCKKNFSPHVEFCPGCPIPSALSSNPMTFSDKFTFSIPSALSSNPAISLEQISSNSSPDLSNMSNEKGTKRSLNFAFPETRRVLIKDPSAPSSNPIIWSDESKFKTSEQVSSNSSPDLSNMSNEKGTKHSLNFTFPKTRRVLIKDPSASSSNPTIWSDESKFKTSGQYKNFPFGSGNQHKSTTKDEDFLK